MGVLLLEDNDYKEILKELSRDFLLEGVYKHFISAADRIAQEAGFSIRKYPSPKELLTKLDVDRWGYARCAYVVSP